ncbi:MAG: TIGR01244 family phosphatase [Oceanospirillaceae bacterium]|nr:TIGR01244 family phosphatase [Oceanospirillaceae bacterium]
MELHQLTPFLSVSPQLNVADVEEIAAAGFKTIICNRPDGEGDNQPISDELQSACKAVGINWQYLPVNPRDYTDQQAMEFGELVSAAAHPVLAYCRTGTRCTNLWALSQAKSMQVDHIVQAANNAGYDITKLISRIEALAK